MLHYNIPRGVQSYVELSKNVTVPRENVIVLHASLPGNAAFQTVENWQ